MADDATTAQPVEEKKVEETVEKVTESTEEPAKEEAAAVETEATAEDAAAAPAGDDATKEEAATATPAAGRRKSIGGRGLGKKKSVANLKPSAVYKAGDIVLAKVKGFSPWPAIVLSDELAEMQLELWKTKPKAAAGEAEARTVWPVAYLHNVYQT